MHPTFDSLNLKPFPGRILECLQVLWAVLAVVWCKDAEHKDGSVNDATYPEEAFVLHSADAWYPHVSLLDHP